MVRASAALELRSTRGCGRSPAPEDVEPQRGVGRIGWRAGAAVGRTDTSSVKGRREHPRGGTGRGGAPARSSWTTSSRITKT